MTPFILWLLQQPDKLKFAPWQQKAAGCSGGFLMSLG
jgi:hypothetical protein